MTGEGKKIVTYTITRYYTIRTMPHQPPPRGLCIHFYTFGHYYHRTPDVAYPVVQHVECKDLTPPPQRLCAQYTGLDRELSESFFSYPANRECYRSQLYSLSEKFHGYRNENRCLAVTVSCRMGMHRSVAMAERLAAAFAGSGCRVRVIHLDLEQSRGLVQAERGRKRMESERLKREAGDDWRGNAGRHRYGGQEVRNESASGSPCWGRRLAPTATTGQGLPLSRRRYGQRVPPTAMSGKAASLACCIDAMAQTAVKEQVNGAPRNYYGKPAPEMISGYKNTPMGWIPR